MGNHNHNTKMGGVSVRDVPADKFITAYSDFLKRQGRLPVPAWQDLVKTSHANELPPQNPDWWFVRCAAVARHATTSMPLAQSTARPCKLSRRSVSLSRMRTREAAVLPRPVSEIWIVLP